MPARAKLNLDLAVLGRRGDGLHDVRTTLQAIALHDLLEVEPAATSSLTTEGLPVPQGAGNLAVRAQAALEKEAGRELPARLHLTKRIPAGAGLGGGSSDAAAVLRALVAIYRLKIDLVPIASSIGADVSFFLNGGSSVAEGRGERLTALPDVQGWFAIAWPGIELATADVYKAWDEVGGEPPNELRRAATRLQPRLEEFARKLGDGWQMTGSGSAFFNRCRDESEALRAVDGLGCWTAVTPAVGRWA